MTKTTRDALYCSNLAGSPVDVLAYEIANAFFAVTKTSRDVLTWKELSFEINNKRKAGKGYYEVIMKYEKIKNKKWFMHNF